MPNIEDLPSEMQLQIFEGMVQTAEFHITPTARKDDRFATKYGFTFSTPHQRMFDDDRTQVNYRDAMTDHIINKAPGITADVTDFNFHNVTKLFNTLNTKGKLDQFGVRADDGRPADRCININHTITAKFGAEQITRLNKWHKLVEKTGMTIAIAHLVVEFELGTGYHDFIQAMDKIEGDEGQSDLVIDQLTEAYDRACEDYVVETDAQDLEMIRLDKRRRRQRMREAREAREAGDAGE